MYRTVITIKSDVTNDVLVGLRNEAIRAFDNRAGKVDNVSKDPYVFIFEGEERFYGCLSLGRLDLRKIKSFLNDVESWHWIDEDPNECCDILEIFAKYAV